MSKQLAATVDLILWTVFALALVFLFSGDPDIWDKWHAHAMEQGCQSRVE